MKRTLFYVKWNVDIEHLKEISNIFSKRFQEKPLRFLVLANFSDASEENTFSNFEEFESFLLKLKGSSATLALIRIHGFCFLEGNVTREAMLSLDFIFGGASYFFVDANTSSGADWVYGFEADMKKYLTLIQVSTCPKASLDTEVHAFFLNPEKISATQETKGVHHELKIQDSVVVLADKFENRGAITTGKGISLVESKEKKGIKMRAISVVVVMIIVFLALVYNIYPNQISLPFLGVSYEIKTEAP